MSFLDPGLVVRRCVVDIGLAILMLHAHKHVEEFRSALGERVLPVGLKQRNRDKRPRLVVCLSIGGGDIGVLAEGLANILLLRNRRVSEGTRKLQEL